MILPDQPRTAASQSILHPRHCLWTLQCPPSTCESIALSCSDIGRQLSELAHVTVALAKLHNWGCITPHHSTT